LRSTYEKVKNRKCITIAHYTKELNMGSLSGVSLRYTEAAAEYSKNRDNATR